MQIALLKQELVDKARWIEPAKFNRVLALYQALPGPEAMELCVYFGMLRRGRLGALCAGVGFLLPGVMLMLLAAHLYSQRTIGASALPILLGLMQPVVVALLLRAAWQIGRGVITAPHLILLAVGGCILDLQGVPFWINLPLAGICVVIFDRSRALAGLVFLLALGATTFWSGNGSMGDLTAQSQHAVSTWALAEMGLQAGLLSFGGAYAAIPFLETAAVGNGWILLQELVDGIAINSILPAPLISVGSYVGYLAMGLVGGIVVTVAVFLPAFAFTMLFHDFFEQWLHHALLQRLLLGVTVAVVGLIIATALRSMSSLGFALLDFAWVAGALVVLLSWRRVWVTPLLLGTVALVRFVL